MYVIEVLKIMLEEQEDIIDERISVYLMMLKIMPNLNGYNFIKECAKLILKDSTLKFNIHNRLFNEVGDMFDVKADIVDRSLRHAIDVSIKHNGIKDFQKFVKVEFYNDRPSPRELLCVLVERAVVESNKLLSAKSLIRNKWETMKIK